MRYLPQLLGVWFLGTLIILFGCLFFDQSAVAMSSSTESSASTLATPQAETVNPSAHLPSELTHLLQDYYNNTGAWTADPTGNYLATATLADWQQQFYITYDGWFVMDKIYLCPLECTTAPVDPGTLIADYQSGVWDGEERTSPDYSTVVRMTSDGRLYYTYQRRFYSQESDPRQLAYTGYAENPVYVSYAAQWPLTTVSSYSDRSGGVSFHSESVYLDCYLDLPSGQPSPDAISICASPEGTYQQLYNCVKLYCRGELDQNWRVLSQPQGCLMRLTSTELTYLYTGSNLYALELDGSREQLASNVEAVYTNNENVMAGFIYQGYVLKLWRVIQSEPVILSTTVQDFYVGEQVLLISTQDGVYAADAYVSHLASYQEQIKWLYLGTDTLDYYRGYLDADPLNALSQARALASCP